MKNVLILMADEHAHDALGFLGHPVVRTPNLDRLASRGSCFTSAYTPSPLCVPARAAIATGRDIHQIGAWDNAHPYEGVPEGWTHAATAVGLDTISIGKLHFRSDEIDSGFKQSVLPMHVVEARGDVLGSLRDPLPQRAKGRSLAAGVGIGETSTTRYDRSIAETACAELALRAETGADSTPWLMFVSFVAPHFPLTAPEEFASLYRPDDMVLPPVATQEELDHPWFAHMRRSMNWDDGFDDEIRRKAVAAYFALVSFMDANVGRVLDMLDATGLSDDTLVIYVSDHGEALGKRGLWGKSTLYEESASVPLILAGPDVPVQRISSPVSLTDLDATVRDVMHISAPGPSESTSLLSLALGRTMPASEVFSQFHGGGSPSAAYMLRFGDWKYVHYVDHPAQLFHLPTDPEERHNRASDPGASGALAEGERRLRARLDPEAVDGMAHQAQTALVALHGGRDKVLARGGFGATPPPGTEAIFAPGK